MTIDKIEMDSITRDRDRKVVRPATTFTVEPTDHRTRVNLPSQESMSAKRLTAVLPDPSSPPALKVFHPPRDQPIRARIPYWRGEWYRVLTSLTPFTERLFANSPER
jgi:hypothetical protein